MPKNQAPEDTMAMKIIQIVIGVMISINTLTTIGVMRAIDSLDAGLRTHRLHEQPHRGAALKDDVYRELDAFGEWIKAIEARIDRLNSNQSGMNNGYMNRSKIER